MLMTDVGRLDPNSSLLGPQDYVGIWLRNSSGFDAFVGNSNWTGQVKMDGLEINVSAVVTLLFSGSDPAVAHKDIPSIYLEVKHFVT